MAAKILLLGLAMAAAVSSAMAAVSSTSAIHCSCDQADTTLAAASSSAETQRTARDDQLATADSCSFKCALQTDMDGGSGSSEEWGGGVETRQVPVACLPPQQASASSFQPQRSLLTVPFFVRPGTPRPWQPPPFPLPKCFPRLLQRPPPYFPRPVLLPPPPPFFIPPCFCLFICPKPFLC